MLIAKIVHPHNKKPEFWHLVRVGELGVLVNYPLFLPYPKRTARWVRLEEVKVDWVREFNFN